MDKKPSRGKVQTVPGLAGSDELGSAISHEHVLSDARGLIPRFSRYFFRRMSINLTKTSVDNPIREAILCMEASGGTIVDATPLPNPGRNPQGLARIAEESRVAILTASRVKPERIVLGHIECSCPPDAGEMRLELADKGWYLQFDSFGAPQYALPPSMKVPSDGMRVDQIAELVQHGYGNQMQRDFSNHGLGENVSPS